jgi:hypothetical protein
MFENFSCSSWDLRVLREVLSLLGFGLGVPGVGEGLGGLERASVRKVEATENWPSRNRCIAMARFISDGWEARAS